MKFILTNKNFQNIADAARFLASRGVLDMALRPTRQKKKLFRFSEADPKIQSLMNFKGRIGICFEDFPFCVLNRGFHENAKVPKIRLEGEKNSLCKKCKYDKICNGFPGGYFEKFGDEELKPVRDVPVEIMIEVEPRCNLDCEFCFNKISFAKKSRKIKPISSAYLKRVVDGIAKSGIQVIRFTGGEPLLRKDIFDLMAYAKARGLWVRLNTNGTLVDLKMANKIAKYVDNVLIPMESGSNENEEAITGRKNIFEKKIKAIKNLKKAGVKTVRVGSVGTKKGIDDFEKMAKTILSLPVDEWEWYRPISNKKNLVATTSGDMEILADKIVSLRKKTKIRLSIANAIPFCLSRDMAKMASVCVGASADDGHSRMVIDPRGFVKPHYFVEKNIGKPTKTMKAWNSSYMKKIRNLTLLPKECHKCEYMLKCRGGSRHEAFLHSGKVSGKDPLMGK